jgi:hypothetical protein
MTEQNKLSTDGFWYVASPYSHPDADVRDKRAHDVNDVCGRLLAEGVHVYSPIWATHRACIRHELPKDHLFWLAFNKAFIDPATGVLVADINGWRESKGCSQEIEYARQLGKPVYLLSSSGAVSGLDLEDAA